MTSVEEGDGDDLQGRSGSRTGGISPMPVSSADEADYEFADPLKKGYQCVVCYKVLRYPVQFEECGHRCCANCLSDLMRSSGKCPLDNKSINREKVTVDKAFQREIDKLEVNCVNHTKGCTWSGQLKDVTMHIGDCRFRLSTCPKGCGAKFEKIILKLHLTEECPKRDVTCDFCGMRMRQEDEITHLTVCGKFLLPCPNHCNKGRETIPREELQEHLDNTCSRQKIPCPFKDGGCDYMCKRKHMHKHIKDDPIVHLGMACDTIILHRKELESHVKVMQQQNERVTLLERKVDTLEKLYGCQLVWKIEKWAEKVHEAKLSRKSTIFSQPFLTSRHGYRMALSLCPFGDGKGRGKFLSIFICICKGEYDPLLLWPFGHCVSFTLIDQSQDPDARRNVSYVVTPNPIKDNKPFLGRPVGERNASFGAQKFIELDVLNTFDYIRDDQIFIKCEIDSTHMMLL